MLQHCFLLFWGTWTESLRLGKLDILQIFFKKIRVKLLRKGNRKLTLGKIILKDPRSRLALGKRVLRPMLVVWVT